jgi:hypothetical protein
MAKCLICQSKKGKRKCIVKDGYICSSCCGQSRKESTCVSCSYYKKPNPERKYKDIPSYTPMQMDANMELQNYSDSIEGALCKFDHEVNQSINDNVAINIIELLIDKYHFKEEIIKFDNDLIRNGFHSVDKAIKDDFINVPREKLVKILGVIHFVAKRRSEGGREYLQIIDDYVGERIGPGIRFI